MAERRLFLALMPEPAVRDALAKAALTLHKACGGWRTRNDMLHLTLVFIGATSDADTARLVDALARFQFAPFIFDLARFGTWQPGIGWLAPLDDCAPLKALVAALRALLTELGIRFDAKHFSPHVTLLRHGGPADRLPADVAIHWSISNLALVESVSDARGASYRILAMCSAREGECE